MAAQGDDVVPLASMLGRELLGKTQDGKVALTPLSSLDGKYIGLYFSAHWCPPCRAFTPRLKQTYEALTRAGKPFEVVFVSSDSSATEFEEYYSEMPWTAMPFSASTEKAALSKRFGVSSIPTFVMLAPDGRVVSRNARAAVLRNPEGFPWEGEEEASGGGGFSINTLIMWALLAWVLYRFFFSK